MLHRSLHCPLPHWSTIAPTHPRQCSFLRRRPLPHRGSIIRCTVGSLTGQPSSLPWPTLHRSFPRRPLPRRRSTAPSSSGLPSSLPSCMLSTFPFSSEPPSSLLPWAAVVPFPPSASHRRLIHGHLPHRGSIIRCTVASLTRLPLSLPSCMRPFPCQTVLPPLKLHCPLFQRVNIPSAAEAAPSLPPLIYCRPFLHPCPIVPPPLLSILHRFLTSPRFIVLSPNKLLSSPVDALRPPRAEVCGRGRIPHPTNLPQRYTIIPSPVGVPSFLPPSKRTTIMRSLVHAPWSLSPASKHRPFPRPKSLVPFAR